MKTLLPFAFFLSFNFPLITLLAQAHVSEIYTDFRGFWHSSNSAINSTYPDTSHHLLAFQVNGVIYSTGVNDLALSDRNIPFVMQDFKALPVAQLSNGGIMGIAQNIPNNTVVNNAIHYLTNGSKGLDLGTAIFNATGSNTYIITELNADAIGDGIPDLIVPQMGAVGGVNDKFKFTNANNQIIGTEKTIQFANVPTIAQAMWKFFSRTNPPQIGAAVAGARTIKMIAYDFADFGITQDNYHQVSKFVHTLSGNSDQPFIAYNYTSFVLLHNSITNYTAQALGEQTNITWTSYSEHNNAYFIVERARDAIHWQSLAQIPSKAIQGNSQEKLTYDFLDTNPQKGYNYYRIKQVDNRGNFSYSSTQVVFFGERGYGICFFPNPVRDFLQIQGLSPQVPYRINIINTQGHTVAQYYTEESNSAQYNIMHLPTGMYILQIIDAQGYAISQKLIKI